MAVEQDARFCPGERRVETFDYNVRCGQYPRGCAKNDFREKLDLSEIRMDERTDLVEL